jgi:hypothetical protein
MMHSAPKRTLRRPLAALAVLLFAAYAAAAAGAEAASADPLAPAKSMGQPPRWKPYSGLYFGFNDTRHEMEPGGAALIGIFKNLKAPTVDLLGWSAEAYAGGAGGELDGGMRMCLASPVLFLQGGIDYNFRLESGDFLLSASVPIRRGGIIGRGSMLRADWIPGRDQTFNLGFTIPISQPWAGKTRPNSISFRLPAGRDESKKRPITDPRVIAAMKGVEESAMWITNLSTVYIGDDITDPKKDIENTRRQIAKLKTALAAADSLRPRGHNYDDEQRVYHGRLATAFGLAAGADDANAAPVGKPIAVEAGRVMFDRVILPYDAYCGRYKDRDSLYGFGAAARDEFAAWLGANPAVPPERREAVIAVFVRWLDILEQERLRIYKALEHDSRGEWLSPSLALRPEDHDTQAEIDAIVEKAVGRPFTRGNAVMMLGAPQFPPEVISMIRQTEDYHVLWIHDFRGLNAAKEPDALGYEVTVNGYLRALADRVKAFDRTGKLPVYMMLIDQTYYVANKGELWLNLLEDPLGTEIHLPIGHAPMEQGVRAAQEELRAAVRDSRRLAAETDRRGEGWLRAYVKVHINITQPTDPSFRSKHLVGGPIGQINLVPDALMIDHRKISFRDVTELDPAKGEAIYTGTGVGEHYASSTWEDRALLVTGPAILNLKRMAREILVSNGFKESEIPAPLRPLPVPAGYDSMVGVLVARGATATNMDVHNVVGFGRKDATVVQQLLYSLMPRGSVIYVPDSIWINSIWAAMLTGAALRGCRVYVVAPALANAPSSGMPQMARSQIVFGRFVEIAKELRPEMEAVGGDLRAGLYTRTSPIGDMAARLIEAERGFEKAPFLKEDFPLPDTAYAKLEQAPEILAKEGVTPLRLTPDVIARLPKLHRKTQLFITRETQLALARDPAIRKALGEMMMYSYRYAEAPDEPILEREGFKLFAPLLAAYDSLPRELRDRSILYMTVGSLNKDARGMLLDGEVLSVTSGAWSISTYFDFFLLLGSVTWLESQEQFESLWPTYSTWDRRIAHYLRKTL